MLSLSIENLLLFIACNSMIVSNKQRQAHEYRNNLESKTQGSPWVLQEPLVCKILEPKCKP